MPCTRPPVEGTRAPRPRRRDRDRIPRPGRGEGSQDGRGIAEPSAEQAGRSVRLHPRPRRPGTRNLPDRTVEPVARPTPMRRADVVLLPYDSRDRTTSGLTENAGPRRGARRPRSRSQPIPVL